MMASSVAPSSQAVNPCIGGTFTDGRDGKAYPCGTIGTQTWMLANLNFGTKISTGLNLTNQVDGSADIAEKYCYTNQDSTCANYGGLYQWHTAMALPISCNSINLGTVPCLAPLPHRGICPEGWHLPTNEEWNVLDEWVDLLNDGTLNNNESKSLRATVSWSSAGTDLVAFRALSGGYYFYSDPGGGGYIGKGSNTNFWTASEVGPDLVMQRGVSAVILTLTEASPYKSDPSNYIRCLQN
jgi:uncharacterized protein (TIGR02145 family)